MEFNLKSIFNLDASQEAKIQDCLKLYLDAALVNVQQLVNDLSDYNSHQKYYILPSSNYSLATNLKLLTIASYLLVYEITKSPIILVQSDMIVKNEIICTPDVMFFGLSLLEDTLKELNQNAYESEFASIHELIQKITTLNPEFFDVDLKMYKELTIDQPSLIPLFYNHHQ